MARWFPRRPVVGHGASASAAPPVPSIDELLERARVLVSDGRPIDAVRSLTEANRRQRDARIEHALVGLRAEAFRDTAWSQDRPPWPSEVDDLFPGELIPSISADDLTEERLRSAIEHHGSLHVRAMIEHDDVDRLVANIDRALAAYDAQLAGLSDGSLTAWYERFEGDRVSNRELKRKRGSIMTVESPPVMFDLMEVFDRRGITSIVNDYFGEQPTLLARKCTLRRISHEGKNGGWHQDGAFMGAGIRSLNLWLALTDCGVDAPGLDVVGRRLNEIVQTGTGAFAAWATSPQAAEEAAAGAIVRPEFAAGDALIFDHMNLHRTAIGPAMHRDRYAIETWWLSPSTYEAMVSGEAGGDGEYTPRDQLPLVF